MRCAPATCSRSHEPTTLPRCSASTGSSSYAKDHFPTLEVYGNTDHSALRLITCGGKFNISSHSYESNIVAYASLVSSHPA